MRIARAFGLGIASILAVCVAACGGSDGSAFDGSGNGKGNGGNGGGSAGNPDPGNTSVNQGDNGGVNSKCAESTAKAELVPVYLVFMVDRSGSMSQDSKWVSVVPVLESFFADSKSAGLNASLQFFKAQDECNVKAYATPSVAMTSLPSTTFKSPISATIPNGGTPTLPAIQGAIQYAQAQQQAHPGAKVAVVLATDGIPNDCNSTVDNVAAEAKNVAAAIPTYVIGVGDQLQSLDLIASSGGTQKAFVVSVGNPAQTSADFQNALNVIRGASLACDFGLPTPPSGKTLDVTAVNVVYTPSNGTAQTLTYDQQCSTGNGWHYDNPKSPQRIILCASTCSAAQADTAGKIDIVTGCTTNGQIPR